MYKAFNVDKLVTSTEKEVLKCEINCSSMSIVLRLIRQVDTVSQRAAFLTGSTGRHTHTLRYTLVVIVSGTRNAHIEQDPGNV
ncbi:hypothetical protein RRG08_051187 [Elysia crispata]|uniref:Uncharacterized protein n=1 Tax=Elysia crispata TaxID=231223 RepID=A0AAE1DBC5_9GAST|nr:hypothetical protein RRG08_051187 [Elysia crispata]